MKTFNFLPWFSYKIPKECFDALEEHFSPDDSSKLLEFYDCTALYDIQDKVKKGDHFDWIYVDFKNLKVKGFVDTDDDNSEEKFSFDLRIDLILN